LAFPARSQDENEAPERRARKRVGSPSGVFAIKEVDMNGFRRITLGAATLALAVAPAAAVGHGHSSATGTNPASQSTAEKQCRQERDTMGTTTFKQAYGTNKNRSNAFGKCVSHRQHQDSTDVNSARTSAEKSCSSEQSDPSFASAHNGDSFAQFYGSGKHGKDAFGKCVSTQTESAGDRQESSQVKAEDNAARQCRSEEASDAAAFRTKYGTGASHANAFGKCVSTTAHQQEQKSGSGGGAS
jgi:hypothetical protein